MSTGEGNQIDFDGIFLPIPTPFENNEKQTVDYQMLRMNIRKWEQIPLKGYCVGGTYGEGPYLKPEEKLAIIKVVKSEVTKTKIIMVGTTCETTDATCELSTAAANAGADVVLIYPPPYYKRRLTDANIIDYFNKIADTLPIPIVIYNAFHSTGIDLSIDVIKTLATHPNICAIKDFDPVKMACIVQETLQCNFSVIADSAACLLAAMQMGCKGGFMGLAIILGDELCKLHAFIRNNKWKEAIELQKRLVPLDYLIGGSFGPSGMKVAMDLMGYFGGVCRRPLGEVPSNAKQRIEDSLKAQRFL